jgi:hypothetical protein
MAGRHVLYELGDSGPDGLRAGVPGIKGPDALPPTPTTDEAYRAALHRAAFEARERLYPWHIRAARAIKQWADDIAAVIAAWTGKES